MLRPGKSNKKQEAKVKLSKESIRNAKHIFTYIRPYTFIFGIGWIFLVLSTLSGLLFPYLMGQLLGGGAQNASISNTDAIKLIRFENITQVALTLFLLFAAQAVFSFFRVLIFNSVTENVLRDMRQDAFSRLIYMPMDFFNRNKVGELTSRMASDIAQIQETLRTTIAEFFRQLVIIIGVVSWLAFLSWKLSLIMLATVPVMAVFAVIFGRYIRKLSKEAQNRTADSNVVVEENLTGISNVKAFTNELFAIGQYQKHIQEIRKLNLKSGIWRGLFASFIIFCLFGVIVFVIWQGLLLTQGSNPELSLNDFYAFVLFTIMMGASVGSLPEMYANIQKAIGATDHLMNLIRGAAETDTATGKLKPDITGKISFNHVRFHYPQRSDMSVLNDINLETLPNQTIALVGSSGAGKSTIAALVLRFFDPVSGSIAFDGLDARDIDLWHLRNHIAYVPQEVLLFGGSIRENILFGKPDATDQEMEEAARKANALDFIHSFPEGFDTQVGDRGVQLSGGQKQRIAIARALLKDPVILILDEATSALDAESEKLVQNALEALMRGRTSIVIAHRLSTIRNADQIFVMNQGEIVESGTHENLLAKEHGVYAGLVQLQMNR